jgi:glycosyltransferase involved in cell wall biosynthesis
VRVLHVDSGREYRGGQDQVRLLVRELAASPGVEQRVLTKRGSELARRVAAEGVAVREIPWGIGLDPRAWWRLGVESMLWRPHVLHAHNNHAATLALWARRFHSWAGPGEAPRVVATRRVVFPLRAGSALRRADLVIAVSRAVTDVLVAAGVPPGEIALVYDGVDPDEIRRAAAPALNVRATLGLPAETPLVANVAALEPSKDQETLIRAAHAARALRPDLHWLIAGEGPERRSLMSEVRRLQLTHRVHLLGHVARADALMRESDVVVMSSRSEGLGSVVLHALALGKPVVATAGGGLPEIVPPACLVPIGDPDALARKVVDALAHPSPYPLPRQFTASAMAAGVLAVYRSLV